ncbi:MAG: hypothetical protein M1819_006092 [Sarea resinae]|nr:MAG: hypothetical protein M1819_006092 [Sarea resinae]
MRFATTALVFLPLLSGLATASPFLLTPRDAPDNSNNTNEFYIQIARPPDYGHTPIPYENYYLAVFHTGAGTNDATFVKNITGATPAFQRNDSIIFDLEDGGADGFGLDVPQGNDYYAQWESVSINSIQAPSTGLSIDGEKPGIWSSDESFGGWLVCQWYHGVPQLFAQYKPLAEPNYPASCTTVLLGTVPVKKTS